MNNKKKRNFLVHGGILAMAGILVRIIGMIYRIPMVNIIGSDGNAIYGAAFNVYNIMLVLSAYGLPMAVSKFMASRFVARQYKNAAQIFKCSLIFGVCTGGVAALLLFFGADFIEKTLYKGIPGIALPLRILAPTIFCVALLGVVRGFFQGQGTTIPTAVSQIVEQIINAIVSIVAGYVLVNIYKESGKMDAYGAAGATLGTAMGALSALVFLFILYMIYRPSFKKMMHKDKVSVRLYDADIYKMIVFTMIPIILGQTFYQISAVIDDIMFNNIMFKSISTLQIKNDLGNFNSSYSLLIGIPQGVASAMSASLLPSIVESYTQGHNREVCSKIRKTLKTTMFIAIPSFVGLFVLGSPIIQLLFRRYDSAQGGMMLKIGAIAVVFYTLSTVTSSALQGIDEMNLPAKHSCISLVVHVIVVFILLKCTNLGIYAIVIGNATFPILIFILNINSLRNFTGYRMEYFKTFIIPFAASVIMGVCTYISYKLVYGLTSRNIIALMISFIAAFISYFGIIYLFRKNKIY